MSDGKAKRCSLCKEVKPREEFHKRAMSKDGLAARCKVCRNLEMRQRYAEYERGGIPR